MKPKIIWTGRWNLFAILLISTALLSCSVLSNGDSAYLVSSNPADGMVIHHAADIKSISLEFNKTMNPESVNGAVSLVKIAGTGESYVSLGAVSKDSDAKKFIFYPGNDLEFGKYIIRLAGTAEDSSGLDIKNATNIYFSIGDDFDPPQILSSVPADGATNLPGRFPIEIVLDEPVSSDGLSSCISLNPAVKFQCNVVSNGYRIVINPLEEIPAGKLVLTVQSVKDLSGNSLRAPESFIFTIGNDLDIPLFLGMATNQGGAVLIGSPVNIDKISDLYFVFSEPMQADVSSIPINFTPSISGSWSILSNRLKFHPDEMLETGTVYRYQVDSSIKDFGGHTITAPVSGYFKIASSESYPVEIVSVFDGVNNWNISDIQELTNFDTNVSISLELTYNTPLSNVTVLPNVSVSYLNGSGSRAVRIGEVYLKDGAITNNTIFLKLNDIDLYNLYQIRIKGGRSGIQDFYGNWMGQDLVLSFHTE